MESFVAPRQPGCGIRRVADCARDRLGLQAKLAIGAPGDSYEQEADQAAERVLQGGGRPTLTPLSARASAAAAVQTTLPGAGSPLEPATREFMESRFGRDFAQVRIHAGEQAATAAQALDARAFTLGRDVVFGRGEYAPGSAAGRRLLAHELSHVIQQSGTAAPATVQRQPAGTAGENRAMRDGVPYEKWSEQVEALYRKVGDPRAAAVARCRREGKDACAWLLTLAEVEALQALAEEAGGDESKVRAGLSRTVPLLGLLAPMGPLSSAPIVTLPGAAAGTSSAAAGAGAAAGAAAAAAAAAAVAVIAIVIVAGYQLWKLAQFQKALRDRGFTILEDPLRQAICEGCHASPARTTPLPRTIDWPQTPAPWGRLDLPRSDDQRLRDFIDPLPAPQTRQQPPTDTQSDTQPRPTTGPQPIPDPQGPQRRACPLPTGLTPADPIPIAWHKMPPLYPSPIRLDGVDYHRDEPAVLPRGEPIGVPSRFWPRTGKIVQLVPERRGSAAADFRSVLSSYGFTWGGRRFLQADHVQDLQWSSPGGENLDVFNNLWPYDGAGNASAGPSQNQHQPVSFCEGPNGPARVGVPVQSLKRPGGWGRYFVIRTAVPTTGQGPTSP